MGLPLHTPPKGLRDGVPTAVCWLLFFILMAMLLPPAHADDQVAAVQPAGKFDPAPKTSPLKWRVSSGYDVLSGDYGASRTTTVNYIPLGVSYTGGLWTLSAASGYIDLRGPRSFIDIADFGLTEAEADALGLGDVKARGFDNVTVGARYAAFDFWRQSLFVDLTAKATLPTASRAKGLGAGVVDSALAVDATWLSGRMTWFANLTHKWRGQDARLNSWSAGVGFFRVLNDRISAGMSYDIREPTIRRAAVTHEATAFASFTLTESSTLTAYVLSGLPRTQVGSGLGVRMSYGF